MATSGPPSTAGHQPISRDQVLQIARDDAEKAYRDLSAYRVDAKLEPDGWHVDYELKNPHANGGGPHYIIDPVSGKILRKKYQQ
ncbi:MAG: PepSY domain-containing protein [Candidatus Binatia bacterium]